MKAYTTAYLNILIEDINENLGFGRNPKWSTVGSIGLDWAYGGVKVVKYTNESGGERDISCHGYGTKKQAGIFLEGMRSC